jgi:hypothetical protein
MLTDMYKAMKLTRTFPKLQNIASHLMCHQKQHCATIVKPGSFNIFDQLLSPAALFLSACFQIPLLSATCRTWSSTACRTRPPCNLARSAAQGHKLFAGDGFHLASMFLFRSSNVVNFAQIGEAPHGRSSTAPRSEIGSKASPKSPRDKTP